MTPGSGVIVVDCSRGSGGGPYPSITTGHRALAAAPSSRAMRSTKCSRASVGGRKMYSSAPGRRGPRRPLRSSAQSRRRRVRRPRCRALGAKALHRAGVDFERRSRRLPADRIQGQSQACGRIPLEQRDVTAAQSPVRAGPAQIVVASVQRQHERRRGIGGFIQARQQRGTARGGVSVGIGARSSPDSTGSPSGTGRRPPAGTADPRRPAAPARAAAPGSRRRRRAPRRPPRLCGNGGLAITCRSKGRPAARRWSTAVDRRCANTARSASGATALPGTTCPVRGGSAPAGPTPPSAGRPDRMPAGVYADRRLLSSTPRRPGCPPRRTSARRRRSAGHRRPPAVRRRGWPTAQIVCHALSV